MLRQFRRYGLVGTLLLGTWLALAPTVAARGAPKANTKVLTHLAMSTARIGWGTTAHAIVRTTDGGRTWHTVLTVPRPPSTTWPGYFSFASIGTNRAWAVATSPKGVRTYQTANAGATWTFSWQSYAGQKRTPVAGQLIFADSVHGWLLLHDGAAAGSAPHSILRTSDGGRQWSRVEFNYLNRRSPRSLSPCDGAAGNLSFVSSSTGWATGMCGATPQYTQVDATSDGGRTWRPVALPTPGFKLGWFEPGIVYVIHGILLLPVSVAGPASFVLYRSIDGGLRWKPTTPIPGPSPHPNYVGPQFGFDALNNLVSWVDIGDVLYRTTDAGIKWYVMSKSPNLPTSAEFDFVTRHDGFALRPAMGSAHIFFTSDSGRHWRRIVARTLALTTQRLGSKAPRRGAQIVG